MLLSTALFSYATMPGHNLLMTQRRYRLLAGVYRPLALAGVAGAGAIAAEASCVVDSGCGHPVVGSIELCVVARLALNPHGEPPEQRHERAPRPLRRSSRAEVRAPLVASRPNGVDPRTRRYLCTSMWQIRSATSVAEAEALRATWRGWVSPRPADMDRFRVAWGGRRPCARTSWWPSALASPARCC